MATSDPGGFDKARHIRYWQRCHRSILPIYYTPQDSIRLTLSFFILSALDVLSPVSDPSSNPNAAPLITDADRRTIRSFVLSLKHPAGGFAGSPNHILPGPCYLTSSAPAHLPDHVLDANLAATSFALLLLALAAADDNDDDAADAFAHVDREGTLRWLRTLQRPDGSFGEVVDAQGNVQGGRDMRCCYLAATIRWCLRGDVAEGDEGWVEDIDVEGLIRHVRQAQVRFPPRGCPRGYS